MGMVSTGWRSCSCVVDLCRTHLQKSLNYTPVACSTLLDSACNQQARLSMPILLAVHLMIHIKAQICLNLNLERPVGVHEAMGHYVSTPVVHSLWQKTTLTVLTVLTVPPRFDKVLQSRGGLLRPLRSGGNTGC